MKLLIVLFSILVVWGSSTATNSLLFTDSAPTVEPLLTVEWGQKAPYNQYCPADSGGYDGHVPTGCVPVAVAMVMHYYHSPKIGYGVATNQTAYYGELVAEIGKAPIDWGSNDGVARVINHIGISIGANYGQQGWGDQAVKNPRNTGTNIGSLRTNMYTYWNYPVSVGTINRKAYDDYEWHKLLQHELLSGRPVIYGGSGHAFVIDGYDQGTGSAPKYHCNWGAAGRWNGWYRLDDLTPGSFDFTEGQHMVENFYPRPVYLLYPQDGNEWVPHERSLFLWRLLGDSCTFLVNNYPSFRQPIIRERGMTEPIYFTTLLEPDSIYYWAVYTFGGDEGWSRIHKFKTRE